MEKKTTPAPANGGQTYPVGVIAKLLMLTERRVQQLVDAGFIPKAARGKYDLVGSVQGYVRFLKEQNEKPAAGKDGDTKGPDYYVERAWVYRHRREEAAIKVAAKRGLLVFREDAVKALREQAQAARAGIDGTESSIADHLAGRVWTTREIAEVVRSYHKDAMKYFTIAEGKEPNLVREKMPEDWEDDDDDADLEDPDDAAGE